MIKNTAESHLRKLKGQSLQLAVVEALRKLPNINPNLIQSQVMSANGEDIILDDEVRRELPISIECKKAKDGYTNTIKAIHQSKRQVAALASTRTIAPIAVIEQDGYDKFVAMEWDVFWWLFFNIMENDTNDFH